MKRNYQGVIERIKTVALAHPQIQSADVGRELEFDTTKNNTWPRFFARTENSPIAGGLGSVELSVNMTFLVMDRLKADRSNVQDVLNQNHSILTDILAVLNKEQIVRVSDNFQLAPLYDYQDSQTAGWEVAVRVYLDSGFECYPVDDIYNTWFVRPVGVTYGAADGTSYADAWDGWAAIDWDAISPGDTLYVCGTHTETWTIPREGTSDAWLKIRGDYLYDYGIIDVAGAANYGITFYNKSYIEIIGLTALNAVVSCFNSTGAVGDILIFTNCVGKGSGNQAFQNLEDLTAIYNDCIGTGNTDDGMSAHDRCNITINGGTYENNDQGVNTVGSCQVTINGPVTFSGNNIDVYCAGSTTWTLSNLVIDVLQIIDGAKVTATGCSIASIPNFGDITDYPSLVAYKCVIASVGMGQHTTASFSECLIINYTVAATTVEFTFSECRILSYETILCKGTFKRCLIEVTAAQHCIDIDPGGDVYIENCIFPTVPNGKFAVAVRSGGIAEIVGCTIDGKGIGGRGIYSAGTIQTVYNTVFINLAYGLWNAGSPITADYCLFYNNTVNENGGNTITNEQTTDPLFVNPSVNDYALATGSPCVGNGSNRGTAKQYGIELANWGNGVDQSTKVKEKKQGTNWNIGAFVNL